MKRHLVPFSITALGAGVLAFSPSSMAGTGVTSSTGKALHSGGGVIDLAGGASAAGGDHSGHNHDGPCWWHGTSFELGGTGITLIPHLHANGVYGTSTAEHVDELSLGAHDPNLDEEWQLQGLEPGISLRSDLFEGFANATVFTDSAGDFDWEWEEYFLQTNNWFGDAIGVDLRGGRYLNRIGFHNATHLHAWDFVDAPLAHSALLGEEGLVTEGGELTWKTPGRNPGFLTLSFGSAPSHDHGHGEEEDEHHDDEDEHHDEEEEHHDDEDEHHDDEDEHGHEGELEAFSGDLFTAGFLLPYNHNDFHRYRFSTGVAIGETDEGDAREVYQLGVEYGWHPGGYSASTQGPIDSVTWRTEVLMLDAAETGKDMGLSSALTTSLVDGYRAGLRYNYLEGAEGDRQRVSAVLGKFFGPHNLMNARVQYNYDDLPSGENEHSVWFQVGFDWGDPEVR